MADTKQPLLAIRPQFKQCNDGSEKEHDSDLLYISQRKELIKLQRAFRHLQQQGEGNAKNPRLQVITALQNLKAGIKHEISVASNFACRQKAIKASRQANDLLTTYDRHIESIDCYIQEARDISAAIDTMVASLVKMQLKWNQLNAGAIQSNKYSERIETLENRLFICTSKFNHVCCLSSGVRKEISDLLLIRKNFFETQKSYRQSIRRAKEAQSKVISKVYVAYDVIENAKDRVGRIKKRAYYELHVQQVFVADRRRASQNHFNILEFNDAKNRKRPVLISAVSRKDREKKEKLHSYHITLEKYKYAYKLIRHSMNAFEENKFLSSYQSLESVNKALVTRNGNLTSEVVSIREQVLQLRKNNLELKQRKKRVKMIHRENKNKVKIILYANRQVKEEALQQRAGVEAYLATLEKDINYLYTIVNGDDAPLERLLGQRNNQGPHSFIAYLKAVERRCMQIMKRKEELETHRNKIEGKLPVKHFFPRKVRRESRGGPYIPKVLITGHHELIVEDEEDKSFARRVYKKSELVTYVLERQNLYNLGGSSSDEGSVRNKSNLSSAVNSSTFVSVNSRLGSI